MEWKGEVFESWWVLAAAAAARGVGFCRAGGAGTQAAEHNTSTESVSMFKGTGKQTAQQQR
jgi:hypothetical protein